MGEKLQDGGENIKAVKEKVTEDLKEKRMILMSYAEAKSIYGDRLHIGAIGMVDEGETSSGSSTMVLTRSW